MRDYALAWELKRAGMDWKSWLLARWGMSGTRLLVGKLKADPSLGSEAERVRAFLVQPRRRDGVVVNAVRKNFWAYCLSGTRPRVRIRSEEKSLGFLGNSS